MINTNNELQTRAEIAAAKFLDRRGYKIVETENPEPLQIVAREDDNLVFVNVKVTTEGSFPKEDITRSEIETAAALWLAQNPDMADVNIRFDVIAMIVVSESRALLRHHINAYGEMVRHD